jgi:hypothetical protein
VQRLHDALDEACARLLKADDQPTVGGVPAAVIVTISLSPLPAPLASAAGEDVDAVTSRKPGLVKIGEAAEDPVQNMVSVAVRPLGHPGGPDSEE